MELQCAVLMRQSVSIVAVEKFSANTSRSKSQSHYAQDAHLPDDVFIPPRPRIHSIFPRILFIHHALSRSSSERRKDDVYCRTLQHEGPSHYVVPASPAVHPLYVRAPIIFNFSSRNIDISPPLPEDTSGEDVDVPGVLHLGDSFNDVYFSRLSLSVTSDTEGKLTLNKTQRVSPFPRLRGSDILNGKEHTSLWARADERNRST